MGIAQLKSFVNGPHPPPELEGDDDLADVSEFAEAGTGKRNRRPTADEAFTRDGEWPDILLDPVPE
jgi:hypothetical protein